MKSEPTKPLISVHMPVFNGEATIAKALLSLKKQTYENWEAVVVNDGSTDGTVELVQSFDDSRIRLIELPENRGRAVARQTALENSKGDLIAYLDSDDLYHPLKLERQVEFFRANPNASCCGCQFGSVDVDGQLRRVRGFSSEKSRVFRVGDEFPFAPAVSMVRADVAHSAGYDARMKLAEDMDYFFRVLDGKEFGSVSECLYFYGEYGSVTFGKIIKSYFHILYAAPKYMKYNRAYSISLYPRMAVKITAISFLSLFLPVEKVIDARGKTPEKRDLESYDEALRAVSETCSMRRNNVCLTSGVPLVSIHMPVLNGAETIGRAIKSLFLQTHDRLEIIVVNDGSTDRTLEVVESFSDPRLRLINLPENRGRGYARQVALEHSDGDFIAYLDCDDFYHPEKIGRQLQYFNENPDSVYCGCGFGSFDTDGSLRRSRSKRAISAGTFNLGDPFPFAPVASMIRADIAKVDRYDPDIRLGEDMDYFLRVLDGRKYGAIRDVFYFYGEYESVNTVKIIKTHYNIMRAAAKYREKNLRYSIELTAKSAFKILGNAVAGCLLPTKWLLDLRVEKPTTSDLELHREAVRALRAAPQIQKARCSGIPE